MKHLPTDNHIVERILTVVRYHEFRREVLVRKPCTFRHLQQQSNIIARLAELLSRNQSLTTPESIEDAHKRTTLSLVVAQIKHLKSVKSGSTQHTFYLLPIEQSGKFARRIEETLRHITHTFLLKNTTEYFHIARSKHTRVLVYFTKIRIHTPLPQFMSDDRHDVVWRLHRVRIIVHRVRMLRIKIATHPSFISPTVNPITPN